jgi:hypothetical protein
MLVSGRLPFSKDDCVYFDQAAGVARMTEEAFLLERAAQCRRLARVIPATDPAAKTLIAFAEELEARAAALLEKLSGGEEATKG